MQPLPAIVHAYYLCKRLLTGMGMMVFSMSVPQQAHALAVDKELVMLVDVSNSGLNKGEFASLLSSYSSALSSAQVLNSIQAGNHGRIAVSLMFYAGPTFQEVGIPWMSISGAADAAQFTALAAALDKPNGAGKAGAGPAIAAAQASFGTETGGTSNGFESTLQIIDVMAAIVPTSANVNADVAGRNGALASGVDLINTIAVGSNANAIAGYYSANVIGSTVSGLPAAATIHTSLNTGLNTTVMNRLGSSITAVPEPSSTLGVCFALCLGLLRRRRN